MKQLFKALNVIIVLTIVFASGCTKEPNNSGENNNGGGGSGHETTSGVLNGLFSVSDGLQVQFSIGNLQYKASSNTWKFADNQWDYIGENNQNISSSYNGWIDLFGWGTSGWNCGNTYYHPWDSDNSNGSLYGPFGSNNLTGSCANADWGIYNSISNGGNQTNLWRTLTLSEWEYIINSRSTPSGIRFAKAQVNGISGLILLPDDWNSSYYSLNSTNQSGGNYNNNVITTTQWKTLEQHGAVFLPASGYRYGTSVYGIKSFGYYWSATCSNNYDYGAYYLGFDDLFLSFYILEKHNGYSVRLVKNYSGSNHGNYGTVPTVVTSDVTSITSTTATCGGTVTDWGGTLVIERGVCWSMSANPTINDNHISAGDGCGHYSCVIRNLEPITNYYIRAYAKNSVGVGYGSQVQLTTLLDSGGDGELNGYTYVDLGLPSGTLWANCNVGTNSMYELGLDFAWGEIDNSCGGWRTYKYCKGDYDKLIKYCNIATFGWNGFTDTLSVLEPCDDAATASWGSGWRTPTENEWRELIQNTNNIWTTQNGNNGLLFIATNGRKIFLPVGQYQYAFYWSSSLAIHAPYSAIDVLLSNEGCSIQNDDRYFRQRVRPVCSANKTDQYR